MTKTYQSGAKAINQGRAWGAGQGEGRQRAGETEGGSQKEVCLATAEAKRLFPLRGP